MRVAPFQIDEQGGDIGRVDAADPPGLAERSGADLAELFAGLGAKLGDRRRSRGWRGAACARAGGTARPARPGGRCSRRTWPRSSPARRPRRRRSSVRQRRMQRDELGPGRRRGGGGSGRSVSPSTRVVLEGWRRGSSIRASAGLEPLPAPVVDQADPPAQLGQAEVGVVVPEQQPVLGAAGEHPVRLVDPAGDQVVDQDADVGLRPVEDERARPRRRTGGVDPGDQALRGGLLVAGRAVDLAGEEEAGDRPWSRGSAGAGSGGA